MAGGGALAPEDVEGCMITHNFLQNGSVALHYVECGSLENQLVILLHGFPSFWYTWKYQLGPLSRAGYHVVAPDMRGYNLSTKDKSVSAYSRKALTCDVAAFVDGLNEGKPAIIVGHDWGGNVAWCFAQDYPAKVERLVVVNMPHPRLFREALRKNTDQMRRSWYIFLFQMPELGETLLSAQNFACLKKIVSDDLAKELPEEDHFQRHVEAFSQPGALTSAINYYRAMFRNLWSKPENGKEIIDFPVAVIWGEGDTCFVPELADPPRALVPHCSVLKVPSISGGGIDGKDNLRCRTMAKPYGNMATHWVMWEEPDIVNARLLDFFRGALPAVGNSSL